MSRPKCTPIVLTPQDIIRFWSKVDQTPGQGPNGECWFWMAGRDKDGYGRFGAGGRTLKPHRIAWTLENGAIPDDLSILHRCDTPPCCRPACLFPGSHDDNMADCRAKGRPIGGTWGPERRIACGDANGTHTKPERLPRGDAHWARQLPEVFVRGQGGCRAKLTWEQVIEMRALHAGGGWSCVALARRFGVSNSQAWRIIHDKQRGARM